MNVEKSAGLSCTSAQLEHASPRRGRRARSKQVVEVELGLAEEARPRPAARARPSRAAARRPSPSTCRRSRASSAGAVAGQVLRAPRAGRRSRAAASPRSSQYLKTSASTLVCVSFRLEHLGEQERAERRDRRAQLRAALAGEAQELDRDTPRAPGEARLCGARVDALARLARRARGPRGRPSGRRGRPARPRPRAARPCSWSVFVLPVPVAPAISPWRFSIASGSATSGSGWHSPPCRTAPSVSDGPPRGKACRAASTARGSIGTARPYSPREGPARGPSPRGPRLC